MGHVKSNCTKIGIAAFYNCEALTSINIPDSVTELGRYYSYEELGDGGYYTEWVEAGKVFYNCKSLSSITIGNGVKKIYERTFYNCSKLKNIILNKNINYIGEQAFWACYSLNSITVKNPNCEITNSYETIIGSANIIGYIGSTAYNYAHNFNRMFVDISTVSEGEHTHNYTTKTTKATVDKNGSIITSCDICGNVKSSQVIYSPKSVVLSTKAYTYNGKAKKPTVTVKDSKGAVIPSNNYTVTYTNNKNVGKATVKITFKGNYSGKISKTFTINPKPASITSVKAKSKGFKVKWSMITAQADGYQIQYATKSSFKSAKSVTVKGSKNTAKSVSNLKSKKKYYVRIRTYKTVNGKKYYSSWSKAKTITTKK